MTIENNAYVSQSQINAYINNEYSFIPDLMPSDAVKMPTVQVLYLLEKKLGDNFYNVFNINKTIESPLSQQKMDSGTWLKRCNMVGINVRTIHSFWNVVKYTFTIPEAQQAIHLLPIWEPGVVASLYGMSSWQLNPEFFSEELRQAMPLLDTVEKQLKAVINILHALGKTVGMDVIPHTDRFSEQVLANPQNFEWLQRIDNQIVRHENNLHETVQDLIMDFIKKDTVSVSLDRKDFFSNNFPEKERLKILFGEPHEYEKRLKKRIALMEWLYENHFETVPATMGPPYRGIAVDTEGGLIVDEDGREWRDYKITKPEKFSRVFGPLTRYKLYDNKDNNADWAIDFTKPNISAWDYAAQHYADIQSTYNFDFMRGDMAHVQMRAEGVPRERVDYYDLLGYIKKRIQQNVPYFGNYAETFLAPAGEMAYGDEVGHLEHADADSTLGDLQSMVVGSKRFLTEFHSYLNILHTRQIAPNFTIMTGDKDDPRFDEFYLKGNEIRYFIALFLAEMPSYMALGFEQRDPHKKPAPNEHYTKLYVFHLEQGEKATKGHYIWGKNKGLFERLHTIKTYSDKIGKDIQNIDCQWLMLPNGKNNNGVIAWFSAPYLFIANLNTEEVMNNSIIPLPSLDLDEKSFINLRLEFSTLDTKAKLDFQLFKEDKTLFLKKIKAGEGRVYKFL
jgi:hypothetical protein